MGIRLFGLTKKELKRLAYQLAVQNDCRHPFNEQTEMARQDWTQRFMRRHPELSLMKSEATSGARAMGFNRVAVAQFFTLLNQVIVDKQITGERIYNCDEAGITVIPKQHSRSIANRGQRQVGLLTSAERGNTVTAEVCCSAAENFKPPMLILFGKKNQQKFQLGLPPGGWAAVNDLWMDDRTSVFDMVWKVH
uniref:HTH CENPB-type domain-containing protein n=1 Tax=Dendroctonus ponderosae TaxID=77166 RepID=A0AAR5P8E0_DENPD